MVTTLLQIAPCVDAALMSCALLWVRDALFCGGVSLLSNLHFSIFVHGNAGMCALGEVPKQGCTAKYNLLQMESVLF